MTIDNITDVKNNFIFIDNSEYDFFNIDFEKMSKKFDAIYLTEQGEYKTRFIDRYSLYGWDCESILIMNKNIIKQI